MSRCDGVGRARRRTGSAPVATAIGPLPDWWSGRRGQAHMPGVRWPSCGCSSAANMATRLCWSMSQLRRIARVLSSGVVPYRDAPLSEPRRGVTMDHSEYTKQCLGPPASRPPRAGASHHTISRPTWLARAGTCRTVLVALLLCSVSLPCPPPTMLGGMQGGPYVAKRITIILTLRKVA